MLQVIGVGLSVDAGESRKEILSGIDLIIEENTNIVITGPNGSGKSTLVKIIMGIEKPTCGKIILDGEDITSLSVDARAARGIGFAFQQPVRFKGLTVKDLIEVSAGRKLSTSAACEYLSEVGLCARDYVTRELDSSLSGGELKRIEIAMLQARNVRISIFDEPEAGIDLWSFHSLIKVFERMRQTYKGSVIIISHQERILSIADRIVVLSGGTISREGTREEVLPELLSGTGACNFYQAGE